MYGHILLIKLSAIYDLQDWLLRHSILDNQVLFLDWIPLDVSPHKWLA